MSGYSSASVSYTHLLRVNAAVEAGIHGAFQALVSIGYGIGTAFPVQELVHVEDPQILQADALFVHAVNKNIILVGGAGGQHPFGNLALSVVGDDFVRHHVAHHLHHLGPVGFDDKFGFQIRLFVQLLPGLSLIHI